jgi:hypothetical protein
MATRLTILASAAQTASANGAAIGVAGLKELCVCVSISAASGAGGFFLRLESSPDGGTTWFPLPADSVFSVSTSNDTGGSGQVSTALPVSLYQNASPAPGTVTAQYTRFGDTIRARWIIGAATSVTFSVKAVGK